MKLKFYALLFSLILTANLQAQQYAWSAPFGGGGEDVTRAMTVDAAGNIYSTGYFTDTGDFDPSEGTLELTSAGFYDCFVQKLNSSGQLEWVVPIGGTFFDYGTAIAADANGNVYITGVYTETCDFDPSEATFELTSSGAEDIFVLKLDSNGEFVWAKSMGSPQYEESTGIGVDGFGNVSIGGYFQAEGDYNPGEEEFLIDSNGGQDMFVVRLDADGNFLWAHGFGSSGQELAMALKVSQSGETFVTGLFNGTIDFDPGLGETLVTAVDNSDAFLLKLNVFGETTAALGLGGQGNEIGLDLAVDDSGNAFVVGNFFGTFLAGETELENTSASEDGFVVKVNPFGFAEWAKGIHGEGFQNVYGVAAGVNGEVNLVGYFSDPADFDPSDEVLELTPQSTEPFDAFFVQLTSAGDLVTAQQFAGSNFLEGHEIGCDGENSVYLGGTFQGSVDLNPSADAETEASSQGFRDSYVIKLSLGTDGLSSHVNLPSLNAYPNPASNYIQLSSIDDNAIDVLILNQLGQLVMQQELDTFNPKLDIEQLSPGIYLLQVDGYRSHRFIKE